MLAVINVNAYFFFLAFSDLTCHLDDTTGIGGFSLYCAT